MTTDQKRFSLNYTEEEWTMLEHVARERGSKNFRQHVTLNLYDIIKEINYQEFDALTRRKNHYAIPDEIYDDVISASTSLHIVPTKFITRFIVDPMLRDYLNWEGLNSTLRLLKR